MAGRHVIRVLAASAAAAALSLAPPQAASAQNIFQSLFDAFRQRAPISLPASSRAFADPLTALARAIDPSPSSRGERAPAAPGTAFCVRTCDGFNFVVRANAGASAAQMCHAFCPGSETRLYSGGDIDYATTGDGGRYTDLDTAYVYRKHLVAGCTCNGRDAFGLAHIDVNNDPTLKPGDVVATRDGLMAFTGTKDKTADFTPVATYSGFPKSYRDALAELKIAPPHLAASNAVISAIPPATALNGESRSAAK